MKTLFIGPEEYPVHGQSVCTQFIINKLKSEGIENIHYLYGVADFSALSRLYRLFGNLISMLLSFRSSSRIYISVYANAGVYETILYVVLARLLGLGILLHHHTFKNVGHVTFAGKLLTFFSGDKTEHVVNCKAMAGIYQRNYPSVKLVHSFSNVALLNQIEKVSIKPLAQKVVLGHISNLSFDKGLSRVVDTHLLLREQGVNSQLLLAGPPAGKAEADYLESKLDNGKNSIIRLGPIYGEDKMHFYKSLDVFLFPSLYVNETQGIVNLEALAYGVPVVAYAQCCIAEDIADAGLALEQNEDYPIIAAKFIKSWVEGGKFGDLQTKARSRYLELLEQSHQELEHLLSFFKG